MSFKSEIVRFGPFELDLAAAELRRDGVSVRLPPQPVRILGLLVTNPGRLVTREEIRQAVWGESVHVDYNRALNFAIKQIREALDDDAGSPVYVETLRGRGYRFIGGRESESLSTGAAESASTGESTITLRRRASVAALIAGVLAAAVWAYPRIESLVFPQPSRVTLAVLPFDNMTGDPEQAYLAEGLTEEMIAELGGANPEGLAVIARASSFAYRDTRKTAAQIGGELGAQYLVHGSVRRMNGRVRVIAKLISVDDQTQAWTRTYERSQDDFLVLQRELAEEITAEIRLSLADSYGARAEGRRAVDPEAHELYLKGRYFWNKRGDALPAAVDYFSRAVQRDPTFAEAHAGLGDAYMARPTPPDRFKFGEEAARRALALDPRLAEAHVTLGIALVHQLQWDEGARAYKRALELNPSYAPGRYFYAELLQARGSHDEAVGHARHAMALDPVSGIAVHAYATTLYFARRFEEAAVHFTRAIELEPAHLWSRRRLGLSYLFLGRCSDALREIEAAGTDRLEVALALARCGRAPEAIERMRSLPDHEVVRAFVRGSVWATLGDTDQALAALGEAIDQQDYDLLRWAVEPALDPIRRDPRFLELTRRVGLPDESRK